MQLSSQSKNFKVTSECITLTLYQMTKLLMHLTVFILGFEKSGGSARTLWKNVGDFQKVWWIIR